MDASVELRSGRYLVSLTPESHVGKGDMVQTRRASQARLSLLPNLLVQVDQNTSIEIVRLALTKDGNETGNDMRGRFAEIKLRSGRIIASHVWGEALSRFTVVTPQGEVAAPSNALFVVESEQEKTRVICVSGWIEFLPSGAVTGTRIPPGSIGQWPSAVPNLTRTEADPVAQEDLKQAVEAEQILRKLSAQRRNALPR